MYQRTRKSRNTCFTCMFYKAYVCLFNACKYILYVSYTFANLMKIVDKLHVVRKQMSAQSREFTPSYNLLYALPSEFVFDPSMVNLIYFAKTTLHLLIKL